VTSGDRPTEVPGGHGDTNPESPTSNGQSQKPQADLEEHITMKVNTQIEGMMQNLSNIIKNMIKEEIKNANQKGIEVPSQRTEATEIEPPTHLDEGCEENDALRKVQRRRRRTGRSRDDKHALEQCRKLERHKPVYGRKPQHTWDRISTESPAQRNLQAANKMSITLSKPGKGQRTNKLKSAA